MVIDAQREYTDGKLPLTNVQPALDEIGKLLRRARALQIPVIHIVHQGEVRRRVRTGHAGFRSRLAREARAGRSGGAQIAAERIRLDRPREPPRRAEEAQRGPRRLYDAYVRRGDGAREDRSRLQGDGRGERHRDAALPDPLGGAALSAEEVQRNALAAIADRFAIVTPNVDALPD